MVRSEEFHRHQDEEGSENQLRRRSEFESARAADAALASGKSSCGEDGFDETFEAAARRNSSEWNLASGDQCESNANADGSNEGTLSSSSSVTADPQQSNDLLSPSSNMGGSVISSGGSLDDKRLRRQIANCNERRRMQSINAGFQALRQLLPCKEGEKMSKAAILQHTAEFIHALQQEKNRLAANNEISAQFKRRRMDNPSYTGEDQMDINEEHYSPVNKERPPRMDLPMDVLECLKVIDELRKELLHEQQMRKVFEKEVVEMKSKSANTAKGSTIPTSNNVSELTKQGDKSNDAYSQVVFCSQPHASKISPLPQNSAFTAISSLQDALNSPFFSTASPNTTATNNVVERNDMIINSAGSGTYNSPVMIQNTPTQIADDKARALSTITLTLPSDVINQLGQTAASNCQQTSHIVVDIANSVTNQFVTLNQQHSPSKMRPNMAQLNGATNPQNGTNAGQSQFPSYSNENLLIQVNQTGLLTGNKPQVAINGINSYSHLTGQQSWDSSNITVRQGCMSPTSIVNNCLAFNNGITTPIVHAPQEAQFNTTVNNTNPTNVNIAATVPTSSATNQNASLSQRNLQAILDAIRHIEGGTIVSMGNTTTSSSPRSQASDVLVR